MKSIAILGGTTFDHIITLKDLPNPIPTTIHSVPFHEGTGSTGAGKAFALTKLGVDNIFYSVVGNDIYGQHIINDLQQQQVKLIYDIDEKGTERHVNLMDENGNRISIFITTSSEHIPGATEKIKDIIEQSDIIVLNIIAYCKDFCEAVQKSNKAIWTDLHDYDGSNPYHQPFIDAAQYIHLSSDNLKDYQQTMQELIDKGKELVVCTHGIQGASLLTKEGIWLHQPALTNLAIADSNGAGDNFFAGFLFGWIHKLPLQKCLAYGAICGGYCVTSKGLVYDKLSQQFLLDKYNELFLNSNQ